MNHPNETKELLDIVKKVLHKHENPYDYREDIDYVVLYLLANKNSVANTVAGVICSNDKINNSVKKQFEKNRYLIITQQVLCNNALQALFEKLDDHKTPGLFLKGTVLKHLYPNPYLRSMSDVDVFSEERDMEEIHSIMINDGYTTGVIGFGNHYEYLFQNMVKVEYHPELVALDSEYGRKVFTKLHPDAPSIASYMDIWNHSLPIEDHEYARQLTPEYHYLYVIMHMMNHFLTAGTGIRSVMDVWVMNDHYAKMWDRDLIERLLADYGLLTFEHYALALADKWFDLEGLQYLPRNIDSQVLEQYEDYILESGTYGTVKHSITRQMEHRTNSISKVTYLMSRFFLPYKEMKRIYPIVEKYPVILPVMWCYRTYEIFKKRGRSAKHKMNTVLNADEKAALRQKKLMNKMIGKG